jgi:hypothetical protein
MSVEQISYDCVVNDYTNNFMERIFKKFGQRIVFDAFATSRRIVVPYTKTIPK